MSKVIVAVIATSASYPIAKKLYTKAWNEKVANPDGDIKIIIEKELTENLSKYNPLEINALLKKKYKRDEIISALKKIKLDSDKIDSLRKATIESLSNSISILVGYLLPNAPNDVVKHVIDHAVDTLSQLKVKALAEGTNHRVPVLLLSFHLFTTYPKSLLEKNIKLSTHYQENLVKIDNDYLSEIYPEVYESHKEEILKIKQHSLDVDGPKVRIRF